MSTDKQLADTVSRWLEAEAPTQLPDRVLRSTFERTRTTRQQGGWRTLLGRMHMNRLVPIGIGAAALIGAVLVGSQLFGAPGDGGPGAAPIVTPTPTAAPSPTPGTTPLPPAGAGLPEGPFVISNDEVRVAVNIASPGWASLAQFEAVSKDDDSLDAPQTVGAALLAWAFPAGTGFHVYGDPCLWSTSIPETPATTPDEIAAAFADQAATDATAPVDVTVGGYAGKAITLHVPMSYEVPGATREEEFGACDEDQFGLYGTKVEGGGTALERNAQGPGQVDELWILDVNGSIVILDAAYSPATPADLVEEVRTLAESASFE